MQLIRDLWRGDVTLGKTFWLFGFGVNLLLTIIFLFFNNQPDILAILPGKIFFFSLLVFSIIYGPFVLIAIWRSANKYQGLPRFAILAKIMAIFGWVKYFVSLGELGKLFLE